MFDLIHLLKSKNKIINLLYKLYWLDKSSKYWILFNKKNKRYKILNYFLIFQTEQVKVNIYFYYDRQVKIGQKEVTKGIFKQD